MADRPRRIGAAKRPRNRSSRAQLIRRSQPDGGRFAQDRAYRRSDARKSLLRLHARPALPEERGLRWPGWQRADGAFEDIAVWNSIEIRPETACIPQWDPGELFADSNTQLFGLAGAA